MPATYPHLGPYKERLCKNFDKHGEPVRGGCPRTVRACNFIHPNEPEWRDHPDRLNPNSFFNGGSDSPLSRREEPRERDHGWGRRMSRDRPSSPVARTKPPPVFVPASFTADVSQSSVPSLRIDTNIIDQAPQESVLQRDTKSSSPVSPVLELRSLLGHPPDVPDAPTFEDADILAPGLAVDGIWSTRIQLLAEAVKAFRELEEARDERLQLDNLKSLPGLFLDDSQRGETVQEAFRKALRVQTMHEASLKAKVDEIVENLVSFHAFGTDKSAWPISLAEMEDELSKERQYNEIHTYVRELRGAAMKIWESLDEEVKKNTSPPDAPALSQVPEVVANERDLGAAMDVDVEKSLVTPNLEIRPKKRKLNDGTVADDIVASLWDKVSSLESSLRTLEKRQEEGKQRALDSIEEAIDIRFQEFQDRDTDLDQQFTENHLSLECRQTLTSVTEGIARTDADIRKLTTDLEEYPERLNALMAEYPAAVQAYADANERHAKNQRKIDQLFTAQANNDMAITTLQNAFRAIMAQPAPEHQQPSPPASPPLPSCEMMVQAVEDGLEGLLRAGLQKEVEAFRADVTLRMESEVKALIGSMIDKVGQAVGIVGRISDRLDEVPGLRQLQ